MKVKYGKMFRMFKKLTRKDVENKQKKHYKKYGISCIILWEDELDDEQFVLDKIGVKT